MSNIDDSDGLRQHFDSEGNLVIEVDLTEEQAVHLGLTEAGADEAEVMATLIKKVATLEVIREFFADPFSVVEEIPSEFRDYYISMLDYIVKELA